MTATQAPLNVDKVFIKAHAVADILKEFGVFGKPSEQLADKLAVNLEHSTFIYKIVRYASERGLPDSEYYLDLAYNQNSLLLRVEVEIQGNEALIMGIDANEYWFRHKTFDYSGLQKAINEQLGTV